MGQNEFEAESVPWFLLTTADRFLILYKWNKIKHRMFSFITQNWREKPLIDLCRKSVVFVFCDNTTP
ncbi:MAG: hypothetical protein DRP56_06920 [Planctomycetota bacterium]|nr:MAG: hypothetical protein DRP56_06920 [Planctomycetota bacterium]